MALIFVNGQIGEQIVSGDVLNGFLDSAPITFGIKQQLITSLADCLRKMGKHVRLSYF